MTAQTQNKTQRLHKTQNNDCTDSDQDHTETFLLSLSNKAGPASKHENISSLLLFVFQMSVAGVGEDE